MATTPSGRLSLPLHYLRLTLADSATWRTRIGVSTQAASLAKIHYIRVAGASVTSPIAVVEWVEGPKFTGATDSITSAGYDQNGMMRLIIQETVSGTGEADQFNNFANWIGATIADMLVLSRQAGYLNIIDLDTQNGPQRPSEEEQQTLGDTYQQIMHITYMGWS